jgi:hypothetical protein
MIVFRSVSAEAAGNPPGNVTAKCSLHEQRDVSPYVSALFEDEPSLREYRIEAPRPLLALPYDATEPQFEALAAREQRRSDSELELLGLKLGGDLVGSVAPLVLVALLLQMLATLPRRPDLAEAAEAGAWFDLFGGWRFGIMSLTIVVLPVGAVVFTTLRPGDGTLPWQTYTGLAAAAIVAGLGIACVSKSRAIAAQLSRPGRFFPSPDPASAES